MTRIYTFGLEKVSEEGGAFLMVQVAHAKMSSALRVARAEAAKEGGTWRVVHRTERRTGQRMPPGEVLGSTGRIDFFADGEA